MQCGLVQNLAADWKPFIEGLMGDEGVRNGQGRLQRGGAWMAAFLGEGGFHLTEGMAGTEKASNS